MPGRGIVARPALFERLSRARRVAQVSGPAGSGKTLLLTSWVAEAGIRDRTAWVTVHGGEPDAQRFWIAVVDALRGTRPAAPLVRGVTAAPDLEGGLIVEHLLEDLAALAKPVWLVIDDLHEQRSPDVLRQLELLLMRAPPELRFVLATRSDRNLRMHRLRLQDELTEIRTPDLRFTPDEGRALLASSGVELPEGALRVLMERTEGWAAGLRLAALSIARHPDPVQFAAEFSGNERTVAEFLLAEVLDRESGAVRRLLLRTSILERVTGPLADALTGGQGAQGVLEDLEATNAFVVSLDPRREWFRYHALFADLLRAQLQRVSPTEAPALHATAAEWHARHGHPVEAIRHAQTAGDWPFAARLLNDHWLGLELGGRAQTACELLARFPPEAIAGDAELIALKAFAELWHGSLDEAERRLALATERAPSLPTHRRPRCDVVLAVLRLALARRRGNLAAVVEETRPLLAPAAEAERAWADRGDDLRAVALLNLGTAELAQGRIADADRHLAEGAELARRIGQPYLELNCVGERTRMVNVKSLPVAVERAEHAVGLAERHGWTDEPVAGVAYSVLGACRVWQGRLEETERWLDRAQRALRADLDPSNSMPVHVARGMLELARDRPADALTAFRSAEHTQRLLAAPHVLADTARALTLQTLVRLGERELAREAVERMSEAERDAAEIRKAVAVLRLAEGDPGAATAALAPVLEGSSPVLYTTWLADALVLEAVARDRLGDMATARCALERALDLAEPDGAAWPFLARDGAAALLEHHGGHRTAHAAFVSDIRALLAGAAPAAFAPASPREPLSQSELRILRYLPTNLSALEIADELHLSVNTVKTHMRNLYAKLAVHRRSDAVARARALGLLAPAARLERVS